MKRREFLARMSGLAAAGLAAGALAPGLHPATAATAAAQSGQKRLNVLFIAADDMRPQLGCYGDPTIKSPNLDRLAQSGLLFKHAYCQQALCSPSRISLLSGRYPSSTRIFTIGPELRSTMPDIVTLPQHFKNNGYFCRSLGKIYHVGLDDADSWSVPSFQSKAPRYGPEGRKVVQELTAGMRKAGKKATKKKKMNAWQAKNANRVFGPAFEAPNVGDNELLDGDCCTHAIAAMRELVAKPGQPFFLAVGFANPHVPWVAPKKYWDLYDEAALPMADNQFVPREAPAFAARTGQDFYSYSNVPKDKVLSEPFKHQCLHGYLAAISYVDAQVGRLLDALEELKLRENTIVIFWGDHGYYMGEHGWWGSKHNNYEGATNAPLMISVPGQKSAGQKAEGLVEFVDIAPSLTELCGLPKNEGFQGASFVPMIQDPTARIKEAALSFYPMGAQLGNAMRTERYRYVEWLDRDGKLVGRELYDHQADPKENQNIAEHPENKAVLEQLAAQLARLGRRTPGRLRDGVLIPEG